MKADVRGKISDERSGTKLETRIGTTSVCAKLLFGLGVCCAC